MIETFAETGSTNADLTARLRAGARVAEGDWLVADRQLAGRGRQGRPWSDGSGNFMGSTVIHLGPGDPAAHTLTIAAALAAYEAVLPLLADPQALVIKWPNDLLLRGAKLSGILLEREGSAVVIGVGINLVQAPELSDRPTIALSKLGPAPDRDAFALALASAFDREIERWRTFGTEPLIRRWLAAAHPVGTPLRVHDADGVPTAGSFAGLTPDASLLLRLADGSTRAIHAGDVMLA